MTVPAMDRPSIAFAKFLDSIVIDEPVNEVKDYASMTCALCGAVICAVEPADTLRVLLNTALAHEC